jgi:hypothetical protein
MWPFHRHRYEAVEVGHYGYGEFASTTRILYMCSCTKTKVKTVIGAWDASHFFKR